MSPVRCAEEPVYENLKGVVGARASPISFSFRNIPDPRESPGEDMNVEALKVTWAGPPSTGPGRAMLCRVRTATKGTPAPTTTRMLPSS
jgi:hypothetical protein